MDLSIGGKHGGRNGCAIFRVMWRFLRRVGLLFWRAAGLRCPNCGGGPIFDGWLRMRVHCPRCGLPLERGEQGYQVGSYMFNIIAAELDR